MISEVYDFLRMNPGISDVYFYRRMFNSRCWRVSAGGPTGGI